MLSQNILHAKLIPPSLREYAEKCLQTGIDPKRTGSWRVVLAPETIDRAITGASCVYSTEDLTLSVPRELGVRRVVSEKSITVTTALPAGTELVAQTIILRSPVRAPVALFADTVVTHHALSPYLGVRMPNTVIHVLNWPAVAVPVHLKDFDVRRYDKPRTEQAAGATLTTEKSGFSIWHMIALGMFEPEVVNEFLDSLHGVDNAVLEVDIRETMQGLGDSLEEQADKVGLPGMDWADLKALTAWRSTFELCVQTKRPFLGAYKFDTGRVPPIVAGLIKQTTERIKSCAR